MVSYRLIAFAGLAAALPLNINLGAYSPALVVGDGEISFGGKQDVSNLMNALEGAAVNAAAGATNGAAAGAGTAAASAQAAAPATGTVASAPAVAAAPAAAPQASTPATTTITTTDSTLSTQAQQIAALQGMGKQIDPRLETANAPELGKRDLTGFDRALKYAEAALVKGPKIQLGTGEGGSGVGILVDNNQQAAAAAAEKRDVDETTALRRRTKVTTMYVRRGVPASLQSSTEVDARDLETINPARSLPLQAAAPVSRRDAIDAVNLNVDGNTGVTMTFVETVEDSEGAE